jgi:glycosyltransferase involved in cell wall biosynthesis
MKIDVFFDVYPHPAKPYFEAQLTEWQRQGHQLRLFSCGQIPGATSAFPITFIHTLRERPIRLLAKILWRAMTRPARTWRIARCGRRALPIIKLLAIDAQLPTQPPDVHFVHNLATAVYFSYLRLAAPQTTLAIYYHGGEIPGVRQIPFAESSEALGRAHVVFSNTRASVAEAVTRGAPAERTIAIPVGFPLERFVMPEHRSYLPDKRWRFVCLGRVAPEKGFDVVLRALAALKQERRDFHLTLIGGGPALASLEALAKNLDLGEFVTFAGFIESYQEMVNRLATFDALIFASLPVPGSNFHDTQACVMQEAMLMGAAVVASRIGGIPESLPPNLQPYLYTPGSRDELRARLSEMMKNDAETLRATAQAARRFVIDNYDIRKVNERLLTHVAGKPV